MVGGVIITHGSIASGLVEVAETITGKGADLVTVSVSISETTEQIRQTLGKAVKDVDAGDGVIIFTDMFGGTPTNIALSLMDEGRVEVITGVNLPLIIKFLSHRSDKPLHELTLRLKEYGRESVVLAGDMLKEKK